MKIAEMLVKQMADSKEFSKKNFSLATGSGYPELVRECLAEEKIALALFVDFIKVSLSTKALADALKDDDVTKNPGSMISSDPMFYENQMNFFYWGIQIGRALEREEAKALKSLAGEEK